MLFEKRVSDRVPGETVENFAQGLPSDMEPGRLLPPRGTAATLQVTEAACVGS